MAGIKVANIYWPIENSSRWKDHAYKHICQYIDQLGQQYFLPVQQYMIPGANGKSVKYLLKEKATKSWQQLTKGASY